MKFNKQIYIQDIEISDQSNAFIIAEAGVNHNGDIHIAKELIDVAREAQVNAVKFQSFKTEHLILKNVDRAPYQKKNDRLESQFEMLKHLEISKEINIELKKYCDENSIIFLTTPFDEVSLSELDMIQLPAYKIASTDTTNLPFLVKVAQKKKPIFLSTGMSYQSEIELALKHIYPYNKDVILMQCSADYPLNDKEVNLSVLNSFNKAFDILLGYSDHSTGIGAAPYSVPLGAKVIEKHFTIDKQMKGPDHKASLSPKELKLFVKQIRQVEVYMGSPIKTPTFSELHNRKSLQKTLVASTKINKGDVFSNKNIIGKRTGGIGISPLYFESVFGKVANKNYHINEVIEI